MNDEKKPPFPVPEPDPEEVKAVQDIFNTSGEESKGDDVFSQDIFSAPPPPPQQQPQQPPASEPPPASPEPVAQNADEEQDVKVVGFEDFDKLSQPEGLAVEGQSYAPGNPSPSEQPEVEEDEENMPDLVMSGTPADVSMETAEPVSDSEEAQEAEAVTEDEWAEDDIGAAEAVDEPEPAQSAVDEELPLQTEEQPLTFKAAKAKEGPEAVKQTQELIEHLDGADEGFMDAAEIERAVKSISDLKDEIRNLAERVRAIEEKLK